jgi:hypothetical protein
LIFNILVHEDKSIKLHHKKLWTVRLWKIVPYTNQISNPTTIRFQRIS